MNRSRRSFTLIELLVTLATIALLLILLVPAASKARQRASIVKCASNLRQIGIAVRAYLGDHNNQFPPVLKTDWGTRGFGWISDTFYLSYVNGEYSIFRCPGQKSDLGSQAKFQFPSRPEKWVTYEYNNGMSCDSTNRPMTATARHIATPTICPYVFDYPYNVVPGVEFPHQGGMNVAYVDGHVAWKPSAEYQGSSNTWFNDGFAP
jgi:prepilin-type processing-associated H-X9-DG protein